MLGYCFLIDVATAQWFGVEFLMYFERRERQLPSVFSSLSAGIAIPVLGCNCLGLSIDG